MCAASCSEAATISMRHASGSPQHKPAVGADVIEFVDQPSFS
jgi:hypothetical protein